MEQDRGRSWSDAEVLLIGQFPEYADLIQAFRKNWHMMVPHAHSGTVETFQQLIDEGKDLTMLTNFSSDTFRGAQEIYPFLKRPRGVTVSGDAKLIKPDPAIYELHTGTFDLNKERTLFINDNPANIKAAKKHGWQAIFFTSAKKLTEDIKAFRFK